MSLGLSIAGTYPARGNQKRPAAPAAWLNEVAQWAVGRFESQLTYEPVVAADAAPPTLYLTLHPCATPVEIEAPDRGEVRVTAMTSSVGPGYHQFVCEILDAMAEELGVRWEPEAGEEDEEGSHDETGYFYSRDRAALEEEMLAWLRAVCHAFVRPGGMLEGRAKEHGSTPLMMAMDLGVTYLHDRGVTTPMGPRDRAWFEAAAADPRAGIDFFSWWEEGHTARTQLGRALALMWTEVRWIDAGSEEDYSVQRDAAELLAAAYEQDSSLDYPWREWAELMELVEWSGEPREEVESRAAKADPARPLIGYRRGDVQLGLPGGWGLTLPGSFSTSFDDEEGEFVASDGDRTVRFSSMTIGGGDEGPPPMEDLLEAPLEPAGTEDERPLEPWTRGRLTARGSIGRIEEDGRESWMLASMIATDGGLAIVTIYFDHERDRDWALRTWRAIEHAPHAPDDADR